MKLKSILLTIFVSTILFSCSNDGDTGDTNSYDGPGGTVSLSLSTDLEGEVDIKSIFNSIEPNMDVNTYTIEGREPGATDFVTLLENVSANSAIAITGLRPGIWTFKVLAKNIYDETLYGNIGDADIQARITTELNMVLQPLDGEGMLSLAIYFPQNAISTTDPAPVISGTMENEGGDSYDIAFSISEDFDNNRYIATYSLSEIPNGHYRMILTLKDGDTTLWTMNPTDVNILSEETTVGTITLSEANTTGSLVMDVSTDPNSHIDITFSRDNEAINEGDTVTIEEGEDMTITAETSISVDSYEWSLNGEILTGETGNSITIGQDLLAGQQNLSLFVKKDNIYASREITFTVEELPPANGGVEVWEKQFDSSNDQEEGANDIAVDSEGNIIVTGTPGWLTKKISGDGSVIWERNDYDTSAASVAFDKDNNIYIAGRIIYDDYNFYSIRKYDSNGTSDNGWDNMSFIRYYNAKSTSIHITKDNFIYTTGFGLFICSEYGTNSMYDWWIKKFSPEGFEDILNWDKGITSMTSEYEYMPYYNTSDKSYSITSDSNNNIYICGNTAISKDSIEQDHQWWIVKFSSDGVWKMWDKIEEAGKIAYSITTDRNDNVYVVGTSNAGGSLIKKYSSDGTEDTTNWNKSIADFEAKDAAVDHSGNVYVAGSYQNHFSIKKFDRNGTEDIAWSKSYNTHTGCANAVTIAPDGSIYVVGYGENLVNESSGQDWWIKKFQ